MTHFPPDPLRKDLLIMLVDDESSARKNLRLSIGQCWTRPIKFEEHPSAESAIRSLSDHKPDVIFLDIHMSGISGLELAGLIRNDHIPIVFVTAFDQFAIQALRASAIDYVLKPIALEELKAALNRVEEQLRKQHTNTLFSAIDILEHNLRQTHTLERIRVPWEGGFKVIDLSDVMYIESSNVYTDWHLVNEVVTISKPIGEYESLLSNSNFFRIHNRYLIHMKHLESFSVKDGAHVKMKDGTSINVARRRTHEFQQKAEEYFGK